MQANVSRITGMRMFALGNPKAWLGTAYHKVLEKLWIGMDSDLTEEQLVERLWTSAIDALKQRAVAHPLGRRFAMPERWPGYHLVHASVHVRAKQALGERPRTLISTVPPISTGIGREQLLAAMNGKLIGKPDVIMDDEIRDYKSGNVYEETTNGQAVKGAYVRQLRLYGHLVNENYGSRTRKGKLLPMQGEAIEVHLEPDSCAAEALDAVKLLASINSQLSAASDARDLATPSPDACRWCQFKAVCPAFWEVADESWAGKLDGEALRGTLMEDAKPIHDGQSVSLSIAVDGGTASHTTIALSQFDIKIHPLVETLAQGDRLRIIGLGHRRDGNVFVSMRTVIVREASVPVIQPSRIKRSL